MEKNQYYDKEMVKEYQEKILMELKKNNKSMETNHKEFKSFDKVLVRDVAFGDTWHCDIYSHYNKNTKSHVTLSICDVSDIHILPYEGNEELVGTTEVPEEEVKLEEGECCIFFDDLEYVKNIKDMIVDKIRLIDKTKNAFLQTGEPNLWKFCIRFADFDPNDMKETVQHILCVKNGKIVKMNLN